MRQLAGMSCIPWKKQLLCICIQPSAISAVQSDSVDERISVEHAVHDCWQAYATLELSFREKERLQYRARM